MKQTKYIFLDFDGVLHTLSDSYSSNEFKYIENLMLMVAKLNRLDYNTIIVVSSSWRMSFDIQRLKSMLNYNILTKSGVIKLDVTGKEIETETNNNVFVNNRFLEIKEYIDKNEIKFGDYVVIDDMAELFFTVKTDNNEIKHIIKDEFGEKIGKDHISYNNECLFDNLNSFEKEFNESFICTYKDDINDGYLSISDVELAILKLSGTF